MIYVYAFDFAAHKHCVMRARCRHCSRSWFPHPWVEDRNAYPFFGQCVHVDGKITKITITQLACDKFSPRSSFQFVGKEANQLSLFN